MAFDAFLKINGIEGESSDEKHAKWIEVDSFSFGASHTMTATSGGGGGAGKCSVDNVSVHKKVDSATPRLFLATCTGEHFKEAKIELCRSTKAKEPYMQITLTDVIVGRESVSGAHEQLVPGESLSLNFAKISIKYINLDQATGKVTGNVVAEWDLKKNA